MPPRPLAVFDVDGTLVDSRVSIARAMDMAFAALDLPPPGYEATRRIVGLSLEPAIATLAPDLARERWPLLAEAYKQAFLKDRAEGLFEPLYPGARELVLKLKAEGWLLGVATGKARRGVEHFLETHDMRGLFDCAFCADDGPGKPDPHMLRLNMSATASEPGRTIMIGDTSFDMAMAVAADAYAQGVSWGFHTEAEVRAGGARHVADTFDTLGLELDQFRERR